MRICDHGIYRDLTPEEIAEYNIIALPSVDEQIFNLKQNLLNTDYIACKIAEGVATKEEYKDILIQRQLWREEINKLTKEGNN